MKIIQAINAGDIPVELQDICLEQDDKFPLHYSNGIVQVQNDGNLFSEWLKKQGYEFPENQEWGWLGVWGT